MLPSPKNHGHRKREQRHAGVLLPLLCGFFVAASLLRASADARTVSLQSLLAELTDVESVARVAAAGVYLLRGQQL